MITCPECNGDKVIEVQKDGSLYSSQPHFKNIVCPTCKGEGEITRRNPVKEVKIRELSNVRWQIIVTRLDTKKIYTGSWCSAARMERVLSDMVSEGQLVLTFEQLTRGITTFRPTELQF